MFIISAEVSRMVTHLTDFLEMVTSCRQVSGMTYFDADSHVLSQCRQVYKTLSLTS